MRAAVYEGPGNVRVEDVPDPVLVLETDAIVQVTDAAIGGSDLWAYRGYGQRPPGARIGHEFLGLVSEVGADVRTVRVGDRVLAPFMWSCGVCDYCRAGLSSSCVDGGTFSEPGHDGGQGEAVRVPHADGTLVVLPPADAVPATRLLPLSDVMATGHHAAISAGVDHDTTVAIIGDGAVGLCAVLAARRLGARRIIAIGHHAERLHLAVDFGASDVVQGSGDEVLEKVMSLTGGVDAVCECVGAQTAFDDAFAMTRDGGSVGYVGVPHLVEGIDLSAIFARNIEIRGGMAPARAYLPALLGSVVDGQLDASAVLDLTIGLEELPDGYAMMDDRLAIKAHITI